MGESSKGETIAWRGRALVFVKSTPRYKLIIGFAVEGGVDNKVEVVIRNW